MRRVGFYGGPFSIVFEWLVLLEFSQFSFRKRSHLSLVIEVGPHIY